MIDQSSGALVNIAKYGEEYPKDEESPINVLFHDSATMIYRNPPQSKAIRT